MIVHRTPFSRTAMLDQGVATILESVLLSMISKTQKNDIIILFSDALERLT
jgi:hypothetical protein